jgi:hypothetical protein
MSEETKELENQESASAETPKEEIPLVEPVEAEQETHEEPTLSPAEIREQRIVERAKGEGWTPLEEFKGDPADWKSAEQFVRDGEMFGRISASQKKIQYHLDEKIRGITEQLQGQSKQTVADKIAYFTQLKREAYTSGDIAQGEKLEEEIYKLKETNIQQNDTKKPQEEFSPAVLAFVDRNRDWFNDATPDNAAMATYAQRTERELARQFPHWTEERCLQETERYVKNRYPERFNINRQNVTSNYRAPSVTTQSTTISAAKKKYSLNKYSDSERKLIKDMAAEAKMSVEDYLKELEK